MPTRIVVVGGEVGGLKLIDRLRNDVRMAITPVDKNNYNFCPPLLYQVSTGFLS